MSDKPKDAKHTPFVAKITYEPVEGDAKGLADVRNITVVQNDSDTYKAKVYNVESEIKPFPIIPDSVTVPPNEQKPTGDMWTPWCDNQQALEEGHYIRITLTKRGESDHVWQLMQSGDNVYRTVNMDYSAKTHILGDYNIHKGEFKLIIAGSSVENVTFTFKRYYCKDILFFNLGSLALFH